MLAPRIVEHGEQADNLFDCSAARCHEQTVALDSTPVCGPVDRVAVTLKLPGDVLPDTLPVDAHISVSVCAMGYGGNLNRVSWSHTKRSRNRVRADATLQKGQGRTIKR